MKSIGWLEKRMVHRVLGITKASNLPPIHRRKWPTNKTLTKGKKKITPKKQFHAHKLDTSETMKFLRCPMGINVELGTLGQIVYSPLKSQSTSYFNSKYCPPQLCSLTATMVYPTQMLDVRSRWYKGKKKKNAQVKFRISPVLLLILIMILGDPHGIFETSVIIHLQKVDYFLKCKT